MIPVHHIAATQMFFLLEGMTDTARRAGHAPIGHNNAGLYKRIEYDTQGGVVDFVTGLSLVIDTLTACVLAALENDWEFTGVFEYEVTASIGDTLYAHNYDTPQKLSDDYRFVCQLAHNHAFEFFNPEPDNELKRATFLKAVDTIEAALANGTYTFPSHIKR